MALDCSHIRGDVAVADLDWDVHQASYSCPVVDQVVAHHMVSADSSKDEDAATVKDEAKSIRVAKGLAYRPVVQTVATLEVAHAFPAVQVEVDLAWVSVSPTVTDVDSVQKTFH